MKSIMDGIADPSDSENGPEFTDKPEKRRKPGIVYLSIIPPNMNVSKVRDYFGKFGKIDRVYLQAADSDKSKGQKDKIKRHKKSLHFTEGWIEFKSKRKAKQAHLFLNNQPVGGKKRNPYYDMLWNIKYLPRFKWVYLKQRLEYEREVHRQRMGAEISQVRRETDHFIKASEISEKKKKKKLKNKQTANSKQSSGAESQDIIAEGSGKMFIFKQKQTEDLIQSKKEERKKKDEKFRNKIAEKRKKRQEMRKKKSEITKKPEDDFLSSVFVGSAK